MSDAGDELRPLSPDEAALVAQYPLPEGAVDGLVNLGQLAQALNVSKTAVSNWMNGGGLPVEEQGGNGRGYAFRLSLVWAWKSKRDAEEAAERQAGDTLAAQMQMALLGGQSAGAGSDGKLTLAEQRKVLELELIQTQAARQRGELIRRDDVVLAFEQVFATLRDAADGLPDRLARECGLDPVQIEKAATACDDMLKTAVAAVGSLLDDGQGG